MEWLDESEKTLDSEVEIANDPDKIKTQLAQHKVTEHYLITQVNITRDLWQHLQHSLIYKTTQCQNHETAPGLICNVGGNPSSESYLWEIQYLLNALVVHLLELPTTQSPLVVPAVLC